MIGSKVSQIRNKPIRNLSVTFRIAWVNGWKPHVYSATRWPETYLEGNNAHIPTFFVTVDYILGNIHSFSYVTGVQKVFDRPVEHINASKNGWSLFFHIFFHIYTAFSRNFFVQKDIKITIHVFRLVAYRNYCSQKFQWLWIWYFLLWNTLHIAGQKNLMTLC